MPSNASGSRGSTVSTPDPPIKNGPDIENRREDKSMSQGTRNLDLEKLEADGTSQTQDPFIVDWDGPDDAENPRNWSFSKRAFVLAIINFMTFATYIGSSIYTASIPGLEKAWNISSVVGTLGLSVYVLAFAVGPLILSPIQEIPSVGRTPVYLISMMIFVILQVPTVLSNSIGPFLVLRFIGGLFASPPLATGGATIGDIFGYKALPYAIGLWAVTGAVLSPVVGPIMGAFAAQYKDWRWPLWELLWMASLACLGCFFFLPETLGETILLKKARRLRSLTGNLQLRSDSERVQAMMKGGEIVRKYLWRPFILMKEPAVLFLNIYVGLALAIFFLWFEAFPIVFNETYGMPQGIGSLPYIGIVVGATISYCIYALYLSKYLNPKFTRLGAMPPEERLLLALCAGPFIPVSLLIFGWSARKTVPWIVPIIGAGLYMPGLFLLFQSSLVYLSLSYRAYAASVLAGNTFCRSSVAAVFPIFGRAFFKTLGIGPACSLLAAITALMLPALFLLWRHGAYLRSISKYAS